MKSTKAYDFDGNIFEAAIKGKLTSIIFLLANGTFVNVKYQLEKYPNENDGINMENSTPLHYAAKYGNFSVVEYLVNQKADLNARTKDIEFIYLIGLLSILRLQRVISMLLNI